MSVANLHPLTNAEMEALKEQIDDHHRAIAEKIELLRQMHQDMNPDESGLWRHVNHARINCLRYPDEWRLRMGKPA